MPDYFDKSIEDLEKAGDKRFTITRRRSKIDPEVEEIEAKANAAVGEFISEIYAAVCYRDRIGLPDGDWLEDPANAYTDGNAFGEETRNQTFNTFQLSLSLDVSGSMYGGRTHRLPYMAVAGPLFAAMHKMIRQAQRELPDGLLAYSPFIFSSHSTVIPDIAAERFGSVVIGKHWSKACGHYHYDANFERNKLTDTEIENVVTGPEGKELRDIAEDALKADNAAQERKAQSMLTRPPPEYYKGVDAETLEKWKLANKAEAEYWRGYIIEPGSQYWNEAIEQRMRYAFSVGGGTSIDSLMRAIASWERTKGLPHGSRVDIVITDGAVGGVDEASRVQHERGGVLQTVFFNITGDTAGAASMPDRSVQYGIGMDNLENQIRTVLQDALTQMTF